MILKTFKFKQNVKRKREKKRQERKGKNPLAMQGHILEENVVSNIIPSNLKKQFQKDRPTP